MTDTPVKNDDLSYWSSSEKDTKSKRNSALLASPTYTKSPLNTPTKKGLLASVANTLYPARRPETPPRVARAIDGMSVSRGMSADCQLSRTPYSRSLLSTARGEKDRRSAKSQDENGIHYWSDEDLGLKFSFEKEIGFGNWGDCWLARPISLTSSDPNGTSSSHVAIKLVERERTPSSNARVKALWNEFKILRACGLPLHKNLVRFTDFIITPTYALMVMDYYQQTMNVALPIKTYAGTIGYFHQLLSAVHWLHCKSVTHCDIKMANLLVDTRIDREMGRPILVDFGFARIHDNGNYMSKNCWGTPEYLSPERSRGDMHDERLSDIWALGVTFFEIATGRTPFEHEDEQFHKKEELRIYYQRTLDPNWIGSFCIPHSLGDLCKHMLTPDARDRIHSTEAIQHVFFRKSGSEIEATEQAFVEGRSFVESPSVSTEILSPTRESIRDKLNDRGATEDTADQVGQQQEVTKTEPEPVTASGTCKTRQDYNCSGIESGTDGSEVPRQVVGSPSSHHRDVLEGDDYLHHCEMISGAIVTAAKATPVRAKLVSKSSLSLAIPERVTMCGKGKVTGEASREYHDANSIEETLDSEDGGRQVERPIQKGTNKAVDEKTHDNRSTPRRLSVQAARPTGSQMSCERQSDTGKSKKEHVAYEIIPHRGSAGQEDPRNTDDQRWQEVMSPDSWLSIQHASPKEECRMESMASLASSMQVELQQPSRGVQSSVPSQLSNRPDPAREELASRLDQMAVLAANLSRMVEESKAKLSMIQQQDQFGSTMYNGSISGHSFGAHTYPDHHQVRQSSGASDAAGRQVNVLRSETSSCQKVGSQKSDQLRLPSAPRDKVNEKQGLAGDGRRLSPSASSRNNSSTPLIPFPASKSANVHKPSPAAVGKVSLQSRVGRHALSSEHPPSSFRKSEDTAMRGNGQGLVRTSSARGGRALSHFLTRYGSRNNRSASYVKSSSELEEDATCKTSTTLYERGSYDGQTSPAHSHRNSTNRARPVSAAQRQQTREVTPQQQESRTTHFFDDENVVKIGAAGEKRGLPQMLPGISTNAERCATATTIDKPLPSRVYQGQNEETTRQHASEKGRHSRVASPIPPASPQKSPPQEGRTMTPGRLSKMKSFTLGRSNSIQTPQRKEALNSGAQTSRRTGHYKSKRNTLVDVDQRQVNTALRYAGAATGPMSPSIGQDPPRPWVAEKTREASLRSATPSSQSPHSPHPAASPGGPGLWSRLFRGSHIAQMSAGRTQSPRAT